jgi:UDP-glucose 4-epimerase
MSLRYFNAYGPRSFNPKIPANAYSSVIGIFNNAKNTGAKIKITGTGEQRRDFVHAFDIVRANWLAMQSDLGSDIFNVGTGKAYSVLEIAKMFADTWEFIAERPGEAAVTLANIAKIKKALDWGPQLTLESAIAKNLV